MRVFSSHNVLVCGTAMLVSSRLWLYLSNAVSGTITHDGDQAIPEGAVVTVQVRDVSYQDAASTLIASQTIENPGRFPIDFSVPYEPDDIDSRAIYGLQVRITFDGRLIYINI